MGIPFWTLFEKANRETTKVNFFWALYSVFRTLLFRSRGVLVGCSRDPAETRDHRQAQRCARLLFFQVGPQKNGTTVLRLALWAVPVTSPPCRDPTRILEVALQLLEVEEGHENPAPTARSDPLLLETGVSRYNTTMRLMRLRVKVTLNMVVLFFVSSVRIWHESDSKG